MNEIDEPYIIGETAFHHEGDIAFLQNLVRAGESLGLNAMKFHITLDLDDYMVNRHEAKEIIQPWCFKAEEWEKVFSCIDNCDIVLLCNDVKSVEFALNTSTEIKAIEIHATGINDVFLLEKAALFDGTIILGTGGSTIDEIDFAINYLNKQGKKNLFLMHGFQNYPTDFKDIKLNRMRQLNSLFDLPIGYADHTDPNSHFMPMVSTLGLAQGFPVLEKHFTTDYGKKRIDSQAAVSLEQLKTIIQLADVVWNSLGTKNSLELTKGEKTYADTGPMKKAIVARKDIIKGEVLGMEHIAFKRTPESSSLSQMELSKLLGNAATKDIEAEELIDFSNIEYTFSPVDISQFKNTEK